MVAFHGANKPTGEARTWPNELTREGVFGLEHRSHAGVGDAQHDAAVHALPGGPGDYTPVVFGERRRETSWAHQIATAAVFTSPLLVYGGHPQSLLDNPAVEMIRSIPSVWDETIVLPPSEIGEVAALARRSGRRGSSRFSTDRRRAPLRLTPSFLTPGRHDTLMVRDVPDDPAAVAVERGTVSRSEHLTIAICGPAAVSSRGLRPPVASSLSGGGNRMTGRHAHTARCTLRRAGHTGAPEAPGPGGGRRRGRPARRRPRGRSDVDGDRPRHRQGLDGRRPPGAMVVLVNQATNVKSERVTNSSGYYVFVNVRPGTYVLTVEMQGSTRPRSPPSPWASTKPSPSKSVSRSG